MADLLALALAALDDPDALPVLGDAIIERGWDDDRAWSLVKRSEPYKVGPLFEGYLAKRWRTECVSTPTPKLARAIVAVFLFGNWPPRWPLAVRNARKAYDDAWRREPHWSWTQHHMVPGLTGDDRADALAYSLRSVRNESEGAK